MNSVHPSLKLHEIVSALSMEIDASSRQCERTVVRSLPLVLGNIEAPTLGDKRYMKIGVIKMDIAGQRIALFLYLFWAHFYLSPLRNTNARSWGPFVLEV